MEEAADLKSRIRNVTEKLSLNNNVAAAEKHRAVSSSMGSETPLAVLVELRESQARMLEELKDISRLLVHSEEANRERHKEMCTLLLNIADTSNLRSVSVEPQCSMDRPTGTTAQRSKCDHYYGGHPIPNGTHLIACIMLHLDGMLIKHPTFKKIAKSDSTFMDMKSWYVVCNGAINADKTSKLELRIPKPQDEDFRNAVSIVASTVSGRKRECDATHISLLLSSCPALMTTVEWMRKSLVTCTGVLSPERTCRFRHISHPFVTDESELAVDKVTTLRVPVRKFHLDVMSLKVKMRQEYMKLILVDSRKPMDAMSHVMTLQTPKK